MSKALNFTQAEFLARLIDATLLQVARHKLNVGDFIVAQAFLGNPICKSEDSVLEDFEDVEFDLVCFRAWITENFGI